MQHCKTNNDGVALIFSGGGGKGAYEIGVWRALDEYCVTPNINAIAGTSVGALNAVLFAQGDLDLALQVWSTISPEAVMTLNNVPAYQSIASSISDILSGTRLFTTAQSIHRWLTKRFADQGVLSKEGLSRLIDSSIDPCRMASFGGPIFVSAYNISSAKLEYFNLEGFTSIDKIKERLLASASIPIVFGKTYIDGDLYWDGGIPQVGDNTPVSPLYKVGYRSFIVIHLSREVPIDRSLYPDCNIIEVMPQEDLGGMMSGTMNFKPEIARLNIQRGYDDTVKVLEPLFRTGVALNRIQLAIESISQEQQRFAKENRRFDNQIAASGTEIDKILSSLTKGGTP